jgi:hypothetical protein
LLSYNEVDYKFQDPVLEASEYLMKKHFHELDYNRQSSETINEIIDFGA